MADKIPFEIQFEIIKRRPVKSLVVFRSVSKAWKSMIDNPLFITDHTNMRQHPRLLIRYQVLNTLSRNLFNYVDTDFKYISIMDDGPLSRHEFETFSTLPLSFRLPYSRHVPTLVRTSQGLLCLFGYYQEDDQYKDKAVIWNPSLGKSIAIDLPIENERGETVLGFGVRPDNFDPMIVMVNNVLHPNPVLVFTLSSQVWRVPRGNLPPMSIDFRYLSPGVTDNRCIYWNAHDPSINLVVAFDMVSEDFTEINLPDSVAHRGIGDFSISMIKGSLALLDYDYDGDDERVCDVWMMVFQNRL